MFDRRRLPLNALRAFEAAAVTGSFRTGADQLGVAQSAVSRHIANLEDMLGRSLFARSSRLSRLTAAGEILPPVVQQALNDLENVLNRLDSNRTVRVHMPPAFLGRSAFDLVRDFRQAHPAIAVDLVSSPDTGFPSQGADIAIVFGRAAVDQQVQDLLRPIRFLPLCAPACAPREGEGLADYLARSELVNVRISGMADDHLWRSYAERQGMAWVERPSVTFATALTAADYVAGAGGVMLGDRAILRDKAILDGFGQGGRLIAPFPGHELDLGYGYYLRLQPRCWRTPPSPNCDDG